MSIHNPQEHAHTIMSLHDSLALGYIELGLDDNSVEKSAQSELEEMERLPVLLRLLSSSRPLSSVPIFSTKQQQQQQQDPPSLTATTTAILDELANQVVARLEEVAATYSTAEGVDVVACHLAPFLCRNLAKLSPLKRKRSSATNESSSSSLGCCWETGELAAVGANPRSTFKRIRGPKSPTTIVHSKVSCAEMDPSNTGMVSEGGLASSDEEEDTGANKDSHSEGVASKAMKAHLKSSETGDAGTEDLLEEICEKTLSDLTALVVASLEPVRADSDVDSDGGPRGKLTLSIEDSSLSERARNHVTVGNEGGMVGSDLGSTVVSLLHFAPVIRYQHVANALCRATIPQTANLVKRIGANCPSGVPALVRGCINAYKSATFLGSRYSSIAKKAEASVKALASLSTREASRIRTVLLQDDVLQSLQIRLAMSKQDPISAAALLIQYLSPSNSFKPEQQQDTTMSIVKKATYTTGFQDHRCITSGPDVPLRPFLEETPSLLTDILSFLENELSSSFKAQDIPSQSGKICIVLRCYAWLILRYNVAEMLHSSMGSLEPLASLVALGLEATSTLSDACTDTGSEWMQVLLGLMLCSSILTLARLLSFEKTNKSLLEVCDNWLRACLDSRRRNVKFGALVVRALFALRHNQSGELHELLMDTLEKGLCTERLSVETAGELFDGLSKVCEWGQNIESVICAAMNEDTSALSFEELPIFLDGFMKHADQSATEKIKGCLTRVLCESTSGGSLIEIPCLPDLIVNATAYLAQHDAMNFPIISPLQLEIMAGRVDLRPGSSQVPEEFLFKALYWFAYVDSAISSLVRFDLRLLPLKELMRYCRWLAREYPWAGPLRSQLEGLISKQCPEIDLMNRRWELGKDSRSNSRRRLDRKALMAILARSLKCALTNDDQSWVIAERNYLDARSQLKDSDLFQCVASTLLSAPNSPPPFCTYSGLCHDPLVLLKVPMRLWKIVGLRRIVLSVIRSLLDTNSAIIYRDSPSACSAAELVSCRNLIVVRSLLVVLSGSDDKNHEHTSHMCSMTTHFLRRLVAKNRGLMGVLVRQSPGLSDSAVDWLVEFVPETMDDSKSLLNVLSERGSISTRLNAAASILRFAIAHGHAQEDITEQLVYAALAQLVSSFFLVLGPVGVPVNVLIGEDSGIDVTQTSRMATFRMLRSLVNVRGRLRPVLRNECALALNKLAGLCKGENLFSGVAGAVLSRRKVLLRDMYDQVTKAANAIAIADGVSSNII